MSPTPYLVRPTASSDYHRKHRVVLERYTMPIPSREPEGRSSLSPVWWAPQSRRRRDISSTFLRLREEWLEDTLLTSSLSEMTQHSAYQQIIGLGPAALPFLLKDLAATPNHWFWALRSIAGEDPAESEETFEGARTAWLRWGSEHALV
jgi:hypothetical protein